jgi:hypothetical protein
MKTQRPKNNLKPHFVHIRKVNYLSHSNDQDYILSLDIFTFPKKLPIIS